MSELICAVVVTFNRKLLLLDGLRSLLAQTRLPDHVVVVDNHSTDGTVDAIRAEFTDPRITILELPENSGGAGGFSAGVDWANQRGYEWIWVMDDDIELLPDALESMLVHRDVSDFIHCLRVDPNGQVVVIDIVWDISACTPVLPTVKAIDTPGQWVEAQWGNFEGALIRRSVVAQIGLPDARFFIAGDDSVYGLLASYHTKVIFVKHVGIRRRLPFPTRRSRLGWYLLLRNRFLFREYLTKLQYKPRSSRFWYHQLRMLAWAFKSILFDPSPKKTENLAAVTRGLIDGACGRFGRPPFIPA